MSTLPYLRLTIIITLLIVYGSIYRLKIQSKSSTLVNLFSLPEIQKTHELDASFSPLKRNIALVIAHPDDESYFFGPLLTSLNNFQNNISLHILSMSIGNHDKLGKFRIEEMKKSCSLWNISSDHLTIYDLP
jgi:hypothetical protein